MPAHKWWIKCSDQADKALSELPANLRQGVFDSLAEMLKMDNPLQHPHVAKIQSMKDTWRLKTGNYRIMFSVRSQTRIECAFEYKGTVYVVEILRRNESTYR